DQVVATDYFRDALGGVVHDDGELVCRRARRLPNDEVAADLPQVQVRRTAKTIDERRRIVAHAKPPGIRLLQGLRIAYSQVGARAGISRRFVLGVRRAGGQFYVLARARARVDQFLALQFPQSGFVERKPLGLHDGPLVPIEAEPAQVFARLLRRAGLDAGRV